jgi:hypothetical protein
LESIDVKVIHQLIDYFEKRGKLSRKQMNQLMAKGYWNLMDPNQLRALESKIGESFYFEVTGAATGPLWGTDTYTSDSSLAAACVHAGLLQVGEAGVVRVTMVKPLAVYSGSTRNGVTSNPWTTGWPGAYQVELLRK